MKREHKNKYQFFSKIPHPDKKIEAKIEYFLFSIVSLLVEGESTINLQTINCSIIINISISLISSLI